MKPVYESPSFVFGINYTQALANKFSLLYGLSYTRLDHDFELRSIRVGDSFPSNSDIYQQGSASGFFNYHVFGFSLGLSKNFTLFKQFAIAGSLSLNYQVSKSNWTSEAGSFDNFVEQDSTFTIFKYGALDNTQTKHFLSPKLGIKVYPKLNKDKGSIYLFANVVWNKNFIHNAASYSVFGLETENSGTITQPLTHYAVGLGYRLASR